MASEQLNGPDVEVRLLKPEEERTASDMIVSGLITWHLFSWNNFQQFMNQEEVWISVGILTAVAYYIIQDLPLAIVISMAQGPFSTCPKKKLKSTTCG